jgi:hypothetical protein
MSVGDMVASLRDADVEEVEDVVVSISSAGDVVASLGTVVGSIEDAVAVVVST